MAYSHSDRSHRGTGGGGGPPPGSAPPPLPQPALQQNARVEELIEYVKQEYLHASSEAHHAKLANSTYESHALNTVKEVEALRHSYQELEREHTRAKDQYEDEIHRLRREIDSLRGGPSANQSNSQPLQPPQVGLGHANLFGDLTNAPRGPTGPPPQPSSHSISGRPTTPHSAQHTDNSYTYSHPPPSAGASANGGGAGWEQRERASGGNLRDMSARDGDGPLPPAKRARLDEPAPYTGSQGSASALGPRSVSGNQQQLSSLSTDLVKAQQPPPPAYTGSKPSANQTQSALYPPSVPPKSVPMSTDQDETAATSSSSGAGAGAGPPSANVTRKEGSDWVVMHNPKVAKRLDVDLTHTLLHDSVVCCVKFSPDGKILATGCNRNTILYDTKTGAKICVLVDGLAGPKDDNYIRSACFSPDGKLIATGSEDRKIRIWDIAKKAIRTTLEGHKNEIYSLVFAPDGKSLYSGSGDQTTRVWDVETGECRHVLQADDPPAPVAPDAAPIDAGVTSVALSPDGHILAAGSLDTVVRLWDARKGTMLEKLRGHKDSVYSVAFAPDGKWLVSGSLDKTLKLWDLASLKTSLSSEESPSANAEGQANGAGSEDVKMEASPSADESKVTCISTLIGHKDYVLSVAVAPEGPWIVSGSKDRGVSFWEPNAGSASIVLQGHKNSVISIAVSDQGGLLATGSGDWLCRLWRFTPAT